MSERKSLAIIICMGSSCFSRGNNRNVEVLRTFADQPGQRVAIELRGHLCEGACKDGPNIVIGGKLHREVDPVALLGMLNSAASPPPATGGEA